MDRGVEQTWPSSNTGDSWQPDAEARLFCSCASALALLLCSSLLQRAGARALAEAPWVAARGRSRRAGCP